MTSIVLNIERFIKTLFKLLWMSVSSAKFYGFVLRSYSGYGVRYTITLSFISALLCNILFLSYISKINNYLSNDIISDEVVVLDQILKVFPIIQYNGKTIELDGEVPFFVNDQQDNKIIAIDTKNKIPFSSRQQIPILFTSDQINISFSDADGKIKNSLPVKYSKIFGIEPKIIDKDEIKNVLTGIFAKLPNIINYIIFPLSIILIFFNIFLDKILMMTIVYIFFKVSKVTFAFKDAIRVVLFSSGVLVLQLPLTISFSFTTPIFAGIQIWVNILMIFGLLKSVNYSNIFKRNTFL